MLFQVSTLCSLYTFLHWLVICPPLAEDVEFLAFCRSRTAVLRIPWLLR